MPTPEQAAKAHLPADEAGAGKPTERIPRAFQTRHRAAGAVGPTVARYERPKWVLDLTKRSNVGSEALLGALQERLERAPSESGLREAAMLLNDLGRLPGGGRLVRGHITQATVDRLLRWKEG